MPVARRDLREQAEHRVADVATAGDQLPRTAREQPVRLRVVELAANDRQRERLELVRVHLVVAGHHGDRVDARGQRALVAGDDRGADATVAFVADDLDSRVVDRSAHAARSRRSRRRRRRRSGRRSRESPGWWRRSAALRCAPARRPRRSSLRACLDRTVEGGQPMRLSPTTAAMPPSSSPISAPIRIERRPRVGRRLDRPRVGDHLGALDVLRERELLLPSTPAGRAGCPAAARRCRSG